MATSSTKKKTKPSTKKAAKKASKKTATAKYVNAAAKAQAAEAPPIPDRQWDLPASYCADGNQLATLREVVDPNVPTMSLSELSQEQRAELVAKRIEAQPNFQIAMIGAGVLDKQRAIAEVMSYSKIGRALVEIEQKMINHIVKKAAGETGVK
ncbi:MAG TPA: hypothetical protein DHU55_05965 [Blastocatellia bacterium]|jgi:hypothetical protein|nr:hypothetical protein [Blastocatellia bacterium]HAF23949.1 hypothetical protein [Blastocatellia bacterium]HCX29306.1 hypothetical protein [Blastocatellia bacterium]